MDGRNEYFHNLPHNLSFWTKITNWGRLRQASPRKLTIHWETEFLNFIYCIQYVQWNILQKKHSRNIDSGPVTVIDQVPALCTFGGGGLAASMRNCEWNLLIFLYHMLLLKNRRRSSDKIFLLYWFGHRCGRNRTNLPGLHSDRRSRVRIGRLDGLLRLLRLSRRRRFLLRPTKLIL